MFDLLTDSLSKLGGLYGGEYLELGRGPTNRPQVKDQIRGIKNKELLIDKITSMDEQLANIKEMDTSINNKYVIDENTDRGFHIDPEASNIEIN